MWHLPRRCDHRCGLLPGGMGNVPHYSLWPVDVSTIAIDIADVNNVSDPVIGTCFGQPELAPYFMCVIGTGGTTWQPCLHVSRAREQGSRPHMTSEC